MTFLRAFLACELPLELQDAIQTATASMRSALSSNLIRWVPSQQIHLTLKFLGDVPPSSLDDIKNMLAAVAVQCRAFDVRVSGVGSYPNSRRPRIIWAGLDAPAELADLQHQLEVESTRLGYPLEERKFSPHLTVGRVRQNTSPANLQKISGVLERFRVGDIGGARVEAIHLFRSDLQATGPTYTKLFAAPLGMA